MVASIGNKIMQIAPTGFSINANIRHSLTILRTNSLNHLEL